MLLTLRLRDFVIVDELELTFGRGFSVLTGETGAGKSILIDALSLLLGERADAGVVRHGADKADLTAEFDVNGHADMQALLHEYDFQGDDGVLLLRRSIDANGRSRAFINGHSATLAQLKELGEFLVDIHGQHAHQSLLRSEAQRNLLDAYAGQTEQARSVRTAFQDWKKAEEKCNEASRHAGEFAAERERLQWQIDELATLDLQEGEWLSLQQEHGRLSHAASLIEGGQGALEALAEGEQNAQSLLAGVQAKLYELARLDSALNETVELLATADANLSEAVHALRHYAGRVELDPERLGEVERRMDDIYRLARKYRVEPEQLTEKLTAWCDRLAELGGDEGIEALESVRVKAEAVYRQQAAPLSKARGSAAEKLGKVVSAEMQAMAMVGSRFEIALQPAATPAAFGLEQVEFLVAPHAKAPARALAKVASGGELSRISLALQVVTSQVAAVPTLIFDEVDVGIGGRVAEIVGRLLKKLGERHQVLCITHLPQVAASGDHQLQVAKITSKNKVSSQIALLDREGRVEEIARMLGGVDITDTTRQHAREMLGFQ
ncbi:DNA repair protein RecN [Chitinimonas sp. BJB300]|uniref:DNA repair protein RecN n=1 Tax=Chitinimonas sp. BJB300 TaxID=1559339 RepID=UPI000C11A559|nr:DNA repair protein RecN [Chitinimonas sp. BJB300]PHV11854.1 DNA repair protein RecN [Chitinimonas sp. BJB300]TSJ88646.1 DNA repair protein RecN [Chitinimonas sp. BJB300]